MSHDLDPGVNFFIIFSINNKKTCSKQKLLRINPKTKIQKQTSDMTHDPIIQAIQASQFFKAFLNKSPMIKISS